MNKNTRPYLIPVQDLDAVTFTLSHRGRVRENNEDRLLMTRYSTPDEKQVILAVLADGVGGHRGGEIAAEMCVHIITECMAASPSLDDPPEQLRSAILQANQAVQLRASTDAALEGMGTTCVSALLINNRLFLAHLGDSRAYLFRPAGLIQLTHDHTLLEEMGWLNLPGKNRSKRTNPFAHVLSRYVGSSEPPEVDLRLRLPVGESAQEEHGSQGLPLQSGEKLLLCSDGLTNMLSDDHIHTILADFSPRKAVQRLVWCALQNGGFDNISVILIEVPG